MATTTTASETADIKAAQIIARSFWKMQHGDAASDTDWDIHKAQFYRFAQQSISTLKTRGFSISEG